jgi:hypothetical protein
VELRHLVKAFVQQVRAEDVREEVVIAVPLASVVEGDDEDVAALEGFQHRFAAGLAGDGIAKGAVHPLEDGGLQQEGPDRGGLALQDLFDQVVDDVAVITGKIADEAGNVVPPLHRQGRQLQGGYPALGAAF